MVRPSERGDSVQGRLSGLLCNTPCRLLWSQRRTPPTASKSSTEASSRRCDFWDLVVWTLGVFQLCRLIPRPNPDGRLGRGASMSPNKALELTGRQGGACQGYQPPAARIGKRRARAAVG